MNRQTKLIAATVCVAGTTLLLLGLGLSWPLPWSQILVFTLFCLAAEFFWVPSVDGRTVNSMAASARMASLFILGPYPAFPVVFFSTLLGNLIFRRAFWYKATYNASQLTLSAGAAGIVFLMFSPPVLGSRLSLTGDFNVGLVASLASGHMLLGLMLAGVTYKIVNALIMGWLMSAVAGTRVPDHLKAIFTDAEELRSIVATFLLPLPLLVLYGLLGVPGMVLYIAVFALERQPNLAYVALVNAQDNLVRGERMAAMGELSQEVGLTLGGYLEELRDRAGGLAERVREMNQEKMSKGVDIIHTNVDHMSTLIDGITAFSHQEAKKVSTDLNQLVESTIEFMKPQNRFDAVTFHYKPGDALPPVEIDPGQVQQVVINLLANAADAMNGAEADPREIHVSTHLNGKTGRVQLAVRDTGPGIPQENLARVFEPHFTTKETGHGFGLSTSFRIMESHHGAIRAHNPEGGGAEFELEIPAA